MSLLGVGSELLLQKGGGGGGAALVWDGGDISAGEGNALPRATRVLLTRVRQAAFKQPSIFRSQRCAEGPIVAPSCSKERQSPLSSRALFPPSSTCRRAEVGSVVALCVFLTLRLHVSISRDNKPQCVLCLTLYTDVSIYHSFGALRRFRVTLVETLVGT